jgi:hypothetical protein
MESKDLTWRKASRSASTGDCVEVGTRLDGCAAAIRDSKRPNDGYLTVTPHVLAAFLTSVRRGELDTPTR